MLKTHIDRFVDILVKNGKCKKEDKSIVVYGLVVFFEILFNVVTTVVIGLLFNMMYESILFLLGFSFLRSYTGGYHAEKGYVCYIFSTVILILTLIVNKLILNIIYIEFVLSILLIMSVIIILLYAPVDNKNRVLDKDEKVHFKKKIRINLLIEVFFIIVLFLLNYIQMASILVISIFIISILVVLGKIS